MEFVARAIFSVLTLYMMAILVRWFATYLEIDLYSSRWRWICAIVDPAIRPVRSLLPPMGPVDLAPAGTLFVVWLMRELLLSITLKGV